MGRKKKIAIGIIVVGIIVVLMFVPIPGMPVPMPALEYLRNYLLVVHGIELPRISLFPEPEIIPKGKIAFAVTLDHETGIYIADSDGKNNTLLIKDIRIGEGLA